jgi:tight adherence protein C
MAKGACMYDVLIPLLAFCSVVSLGGLVLSVRAARRSPIDARLREVVEDIGHRALSDDHSGLLRAVGRVGESVSSKGPSEGLKVELARAGYHASNAATVYLGCKVLLLVSGLILLAALVLPTELGLLVKFLLVLGGAAVLSFIPNVVVGLQRKKRSDETRQHLPDALDLLEICVSSGMGLDMAWNAVADEMRHVSPVLAEEMALANLEMHLGAPRATALRHMAQRTGAEDLSSLVAVLVQSERFGTSVGEALRTFAVSMRQGRSQRAEEAAEKMAVKLLFPMVLFIFPAIFVVAVGPAGIKLAEILGGG